MFLTFLGLLRPLTIRACVCTFIYIILFMYIVIYIKTSYTYTHNICKMRKSIHVAMATTATAATVQDATMQLGKRAGERWTARRIRVMEIV